jgi:hypothetical protein
MGDDAFSAKDLKLRPEQLEGLRPIETGASKPKRRISRKSHMTNLIALLRRRTLPPGKFSFTSCLSTGNLRARLSDWLMAPSNKSALIGLQNLALYLN